MTEIQNNLNEQLSFSDKVKDMSVADFLDWLKDKSINWKELRENWLTKIDINITTEITICFEINSNDEIYLWEGTTFGKIWMKNDDWGNIMMVSDQNSDKNIQKLDIKEDNIKNLLSILNKIVNNETLWNYESNKKQTQDALLTSASLSNSVEIQLKEVNYIKTDITSINNNNEKLSNNINSSQLSDLEDIYKSYEASEVWWNAALEYLYKKNWLDTPEKKLSWILKLVSSHWDGVKAEFFQSASKLNLNQDFWNQVQNTFKSTPIKVPNADTSFISDFFSMINDNIKWWNSAATNATRFAANMKNN